MRATIGDVMRRPSYLSDWWLELPLRRNVTRRAWWRWLLFEKGQGWLRWAADERESVPNSWYEPAEPYVVWPPLRRLYAALRYRAMWPFGFRDEDRKRHAAW